MKKGDIVWIEWSDITTNLSTEVIPEPIPSIAVGRVLCMRGKRVVLTSGWYVDEKEWPAKDTITLPKGCIDRVEVLK